MIWRNGHLPNAKSPVKEKPCRALARRREMPNQQNTASMADGTQRILSIRCELTKEKRVDVLSR